MEPSEFMAKYPFTAEARRFIETEAKAMDGLHDELDYALERAKQSVAGPRRQRWPLDLEVYTYPIAKIFVAILNDSYVARRFARGEAQRVERIMAEDSPENAARAASEFFSLEAAGDGYAIPVVQYLNAAPQADEFRPVNNDLSKGMVRITQKALASLTAEAVFMSIMSVKAQKKDFPRRFADMAGELKALSRAPDEAIMGPVNNSAFPPCMRKIYSDLQTQGNVGHAARFAFACFLGNVNVGVDEAVKMYSKQENFSESKARYHLEHAFGLKTGTKYSAPSCSKMQTYGLCCKDASCKWPTPLIYYKNIAFRRKKP